MSHERKMEQQHERLEAQHEHLEAKEDRLERKEEHHERNFESVNGLTPAFHPGRRTHVLLSHGSGEGWITEAPHSASDAFLAWMMTYQPLVHALKEKKTHERVNEIIEDFHRECRVGYNIDRIRTPHAKDLVVEEVGEPFEVKEHEGHEKIVHLSHSAIAVHRRVVRI